MTAPVCPVSDSQLPYYRSLFRGSGGQPRPVTVPSIPAATDLPSLIRTVNVMRDVLRQYTSSLVVNNLYKPSPPFFKAEGNTHYTDYPAWDQKEVEAVTGFMYHHDGGTIDKTSRLWVQRLNAVHFENRSHDDPEFVWRYVKQLDEPGTEPLFPTGSFTGE